MKEHASKSRSGTTGKKKETPQALPMLAASYAGAEGIFLMRKASCACGGGCPSCSAGLKVSNPNDAAEVEADRIADRVMRMPADRVSPVNKITPAKKTIHRKCNTCEDEEQTIQRKPIPSNGSQAPSQGSGHVREALLSGGRPLDRETRGFFEPRMGYDLAGVRIYTGAAAERSALAVDAKAYTLGSDIVFGSGQFAPGTEEGRRLLAHELAHTVQQNTSGIMHRTARGSAAGCGICMNDPGGREAGIIAHAEVQMAMAAHNPEIIAEFVIPVVEEGKVPPFVPEVDLYYTRGKKSGKIAYIGEIKPLDDGGVQAGIARNKLKDYARELKANPALGIDEVFRMTDPPPAEPLYFHNPLNPPGCPRQLIYVRLTEPGVYQYYCEPPFSTLVKDPKCKCKKKPEDDKEPKGVPVAKPQAEPKDVKEPKADPKPNDVPQGVDDGVPNWVLPAAAAAGLAGLSAATIAYLRKRAIEEAEKRAAQLAWRKMAEAAAAKRAAAAAGKGAAGKAVAKAAIYAEIAAAVALIVLYPERVEASTGPGASSIETLYKAMTSNGMAPSPEMKALIESDPVLKQMAEDAAGSGDMSKLQQEMATRTLQMIKDNPGMFSPEDLEFLTEYSKTAKGKGGTAPATADELRKAIDAAKAGKTGDGQGAGSGGTGSGAGKPDVPKPADGTPTPAAADKGDGAGKGDAAGQPGVLPTPATPADTPAKPPVDTSTLSDANKAKVSGAEGPVTDVLREYITKQKTDKKIDDDFIKRFFEIVPADLTPDQAAALISRMTAAPPDATREAMMESLKKGVEEVRKTPSPTPGGETTGTPTTATPAKPAKTEAEIIADLKAVAQKFNFGAISPNSYSIADIKGKIDGTNIKTYIYAKTGAGVGVVGYITATVPAGVDISKLKKGQTFTITITSRSPMVDKQGNVHKVNIGSTLTLGTGK